MPAGPPSKSNHSYDFLATAADEAGNIYVASTRLFYESSREIEVYISRRSPSGEWAGPFQISSGGTNPRPALAAGGAGRVGLSWYHTDNPEAADSNRPLDGLAPWYLMSAVSADADSATPTFLVSVADPEPVIQGRWAAKNNLGHLIQSEVTPDGHFAMIYARQEPGQEPRVFFTRMLDGPDLAPENYPNAVK